MKLKNYTGSDLRIVDGDMILKTIARDGHSTASKTERVWIDVENVFIKNKVYGTVCDLPDPQEDVFLIVNREVADALPDRHDLLIPIGAIKDSKGSIIGYNDLERN